MRESAPTRPRQPLQLRAAQVPLDLVLLEDDSRSMRLRDPRRYLRIRAAAAALSLIGRDVSGAHDKIGFASFGSSDRVEILKLTRVACNARREAILRWIIRATTSDDGQGGTDYDGGLRAAVDALQDGDPAYSRPGYPRYRAAGRAMGVVLVSDGLPQPDVPCLELFRRRSWPLYLVDIGDLADPSCDPRDVYAGIVRQLRGQWGATAQDR